MKRGKMSTAVLICLLLVSSNLYGQFGEKLRLNAFGDMSFGVPFGAFADEEAAELFEQFGNTETSIHDGFGVFGIDFVLTNYLTDDLTLQLEYQLEVEEQSEVEADLERLYMDYGIRDWFNIQFGGFFTPIGYFNRNLYSRSWLMFQVQRPELFEEELGGFVPTHMVGINFYGNMSLSDEHTLNYAFSIGNGAGANPTGRIYKQENNRSKQLTALIEWIVPKAKDFRIGLSGWTDNIKTLKLDNLGDTGELEEEGGEENEEGAGEEEERIELSEIGFNPYITIFSKHFNLNFEYVFIRQKDLDGNLGGASFDLNGFGAEFSLNLIQGKMHPYVRYDVINLPPDGGPYFPLRSPEGQNDTLVRTFLPEVQRALVGIAYDLNLNLRLKVEYNRNFNGFRRANQLTWQAAYAF